MFAYRAARRIAVGGMAEVLLASQVGAGNFERLVVIKRILPQFRTNETFINRMFSEARLVASLKHPNIVEIYDITGEGDDYSIMMEYLSGEDLRYILKATARAGIHLPIALTCRIMWRVADALECARCAVSMDGHAQPIIHRDVSPSNIIVCYDGRTKVVDFGLAKAVGAPRTSEPGTITGKLLYLSPEHLSPEDLDWRSDLFSLGVVFHELLTSRRLFSGPSQAAIIRNVLERPIPPPSLYNPEVSDELDAVVLGLLERDRNRRTPTAGVLRDQLSEVLGRIEDGLDHSLASWMQQNLAERRENRTRVEREVIAEARQNSMPPSSDSLLPLFENTGDSGFASRRSSRFPIPVSIHSVPKPVIRPSEPRLEADGATRELPQPSARLPLTARTSAPALAVPSMPVRPPQGELLPQDEEAPAPISESASSPELAAAHDPSGQTPPAPAEQILATTDAPVPPPRLRPRMKAGLLIGFWLAGAAVIALTLALGLRPDDEQAADSELVTKTEPVAAAKEVELLVHVVPDGAELTVNGKNIVQDIGTDGALVKVPSGQDVKLVVSKNGYEAYEATLQTQSSGVMPVYVTLEKAPEATPAPIASTPAVERRRNRSSGPRRRRAAANRRSQREETAAKRGSSTLVVSYKPLDASLYVNGDKRAGRSPLRLNVAAGRQRIRISAPGYVTEERVVTTNRGKVHRVNVDLQAQAPRFALMDIRSSPSGARVRVNGEFRGETPIRDLKVKPGQSVAVNITQAGYRPWSKTVMPAVGKPISVSAELEPIPEPKVAAKPTPPPAKPATPVKPSNVSSADVTKISGSLPVIRLRGFQVKGNAPSETKPITARLCINTKGSVTSIKLTGNVPDKIIGSLKRKLQGWRYRPYRRSGQAVPACFSTSFKLKIEVS